MNTNESEPLAAIVRQYKLVTWFLAGMLIGCGLFGLVGYLSLRANDQAIVAARAAARFRECERDNAQLKKAIKRERQSWDSFIFRSFDAQGLQPSESQRAQIEPFLKEQEQAVRDEFSDRAPRKCDKNSLDEYYTRQATQ